MLSAEDWAITTTVSGPTLAGLITLITGNIYTLFKVITVKRAAERTATAAKVTSEKIEPISNGFASNVKESLEEIKGMIRDSNKRMDDHLESHSRKD